MDPAGLVRWTAGYFKDHQIESARSEAEILLAHCLGARRIDLYLNHDQPLCDDELARFKALIKRRVAREPVAYITGTREFWSLELAVNPSVLIPRPETECLVEAVLPVLDDPGRSPKRVLEMGTGSGAIVIALAHEHPEHRYVAMDRSAAALQDGPAKCPHAPGGRSHRLVLRRLGCGPGAGREAFDLIVSNPPYIRSGDMNRSAAGNPPSRTRLALDGSGDGLLHSADHRFGPSLPAPRRSDCPGNGLRPESGCPGHRRRGGDYDPEWLIQ
jgi:release factor glutamine methyltransferase